MEPLHYKDRPNRNVVELKAVLTRIEGGTHDVAIENMSVDGCCVSGSFLIGERVVLKVPGSGKFEAQIRWAMHGRAGLRFIKGEAR